ncbi:hypothetical protein [Caldicellulosiruptor morganii]|uniref:Uncharacterized protein n=1 Tax=Caldicellulosiruptor morganii TaxID=1387555 RepID=A0ABY7BM12_9FIRM|nr:hypothetical protein [Caldicellulosiruptor morganii]WAM33882.1 hypothetical protein OTK00_000022 [Caldicellulosiruptor morganii]
MDYLQKIAKKIYDDIVREYELYNQFKAYIKQKTSAPTEPEEILYLYCMSNFNERSELANKDSSTNNKNPQTDLIDSGDYHDEFIDETESEDWVEDFYYDEYDMSSEMDDIVNDSDFWDAFDYEWND